MATQTSEKKELVRTYLAAWTEENIETIRDLLAEDFSASYTEPSGDDVSLDREGFEELLAGYFGAFSDWGHEVHEMVGEGNRVVTRITYTGVHDGEFLGIDPTGERVEVEEYLSFHVDGGELVELHWLGNDLDLFRQLGIEHPIAYDSTSDREQLGTLTEKWETFDRTLDVSVVQELLAEDITFLPPGEAPVVGKADALAYLQFPELEGTDDFDQWPENMWIGQNLAVVQVAEKGTMGFEESEDTIELNYKGIDVYRRTEESGWEQIISIWNDQK